MLPNWIRTIFITVTCGHLHVKMVKAIISHFKVYDGQDKGQVSQLTSDDIPISADYKLATFPLTWTILSVYEFKILKSNLLGTSGSFT